MLLRYATPFFFNFLKKNPRSWKFKTRRFHATGIKLWRKKKDDDEPKITRPGNCAELPKPMLVPSCINAIVVGGVEGFGITAADHLLSEGANMVIIADEDPEAGEKAKRKLCDNHGKNRVSYIEFDIRDVCQAEAGLRAAFCKVKQVHLIFNNLDKDRVPLKNSNQKNEEPNAAKAIRAGLNVLTKNENRATGGIIISCASIYGFMEWPHDPYPVYCKKEPVIEITEELADEFHAEKTGIRLVAMCPSRKLFSNIALPVFPKFIPNKYSKKLPDCMPIYKHHIGPALCHLMAWAESGTAWLVEPAISVHRIPRLIYFPDKPGDKARLKSHGEQSCSIKIDPPCVDTSKACVPPKKK